MIATTHVKHKSVDVASSRSSTEVIARKPPSYRLRQRLMKTVITLLLLAGSVLILLPVWWMISTSLKTMPEIMHYPPTFFPEKFQWQNYLDTWKAAPFNRYLLNTVTITAAVVVGSVLSNSFIAYGFAKIKFRGRGFLFAIVLSTMMIPGFVTMIPQYILFSKLHWINTYLPLIVPHFFGSAFFIFLLRQFYLQIPDELIEAAKMDGASHLYIWWKIILPLSKPALATIAIFAFNGAWNDFQGPLLYLNDESLYTLQLGLESFKGQNITQWNYLMSGSLMVLLPVIILFFSFQKYFIKGINLQSGSKG